MPAESCKSYEDLEEIAKKEKRRIEDAIRGKGLQYSACPRFTVAVKGQKVVAVDFCDLYACFLSLGVKFGLQSF